MKIELAPSLAQINKTLPQFQSIPRCMTFQQFADWIDCVRSEDDLRCGVCTDCLPEYQTQMRRVGLCDHPEVQFRREPDGYVSGFLVDSKYLRKTYIKLHVVGAAIVRETA